MNIQIGTSEIGILRQYVDGERVDGPRCCHYHGETDTFCRNDARPGSHYCAEHKADQR